MTERDYLFRMACPLCSRTEDLASSGKKECFAGDTVTHADKAKVSVDVCWWCYYRFDVWFNKKYSDKSPTPLDMAAYSAHILFTRPKWLGDKYAHHAKHKLTESPAERLWHRDKQRSKWAAQRVTNRAEFAHKLRAIPKADRRLHLHIYDNDPKDIDFPEAERDAVLSTYGVVVCDACTASYGEDGCSGDWRTMGKGRCVSTSLLDNCYRS